MLLAALFIYYVVSLTAKPYMVVENLFYAWAII